MNARQTKKKLNQKISRLESDNNLMRRIIEGNRAMQDLYDKYSEPVKVQNTTMDFQEIRAKRRIPTYMMEVDGFEEHIKRALAQDILETIKDDISYIDETTQGEHRITASIFVGRKD